MNAVKGLGTAVLCILLFIIVGLIGTATWLKATVLNQEFVAGEVAKIDITELATNIINEELNFELAPEFAIAEPVVKDLAIAVIGEYEPWLKDQFDRITRQIYDYLQGRTDMLAISIDLTEIKATLKDNLWALYTEKASTYLPQILSGVEDYIVENPAEIIQYIPEDFLPPEARLLNQDQLVAYLEANKDLLRAQIDSLDTDAILAQLTDDTVQPFFDQFIDDGIGQIPDVYDVNTELLGDEGLRQLADARRYLGYFETGYWGAIGAAIVLVFFIWLVWREIKRPARAVGITLALYGFLELAGTIIARSINPFDYSQGLDVPGYLQTLAVNIYHDIIMPMLTFNIIVLVVGVLLLTLSFVLKSGSDSQPQPVED